MAVLELVLEVGGVHGSKRNTYSAEQAGKILQ